MTDTVTRDKLLTLIEAAPEGSEQIDAQIVACLVGDDAYIMVSPINGAWCVYQGYDRQQRPRLWQAGQGSELRQRRAYSTSLDAKLPNEDIVCTAEQEAPRGKKPKWMALNRFPKNTYGHASLAHTEALARRAAAIRGMQDD